MDISIGLQVHGNIARQHNNSSNNHFLLALHFAVEKVSGQNLRHSSGKYLKIFVVTTLTKQRNAWVSLDEDPEKR